MQVLLETAGWFVGLRNFLQTFSHILSQILAGGTQHHRLSCGPQSLKGRLLPGTTAPPLLPAFHSHHLHAKWFVWVAWLVCCFWVQAEGHLDPIGSAAEPTAGCLPPEGASGQLGPYVVIKLHLIC